MNGFPDGYEAVPPVPIDFSLSGIQAPTTTSTTNPFEVAIYYVEGTNEVARYKGPGLEYTALPSNKIDMEVELSDTLTG